MFSIGNGIKSTFKKNSVLQVYPERIFYMGIQELFLTSPCLTINYALIVMFGSKTIECRVTEYCKIKCLTPYLDKLGKVKVRLFY